MIYILFFRFRPVFKHFSKEIDTFSTFALYKQDTSKMTTDDIIKHIQESRRYICRNYYNSLYFLEAKCELKTMFVNNILSTIFCQQCLVVIFFMFFN